MHANVQKAIILTFSITNRLFSKTRTVSRRKRLIAPFGMPHLVSGINCLVLSVNLILVPLSPSCLFMLLPHLLALSTRHSHHPYLPLSFTSGSRPTSFTNLSHHRLPSNIRTDSTNFITGPFLLSISVFMVALCNRADHNIFIL